MKYNIRKWDPATMLKPHRKVLYVGSSGRGKSCAMRAVLRHMPKVDLALAFTPTEETAAELGKLMPPSCIHDSLDLGVVERAMELQMIGRVVRIGQARQTHVYRLVARGGDEEAVGIERQMA